MLIPVSNPFCKCFSFQSVCHLKIDWSIISPDNVKMLTLTLECVCLIIELDSSDAVNVIVILQLNPRKPHYFTCLVFLLTSLQMLARKSIRSSRT